MRYFISQSPIQMIDYFFILIPEYVFKPPFYPDVRLIFDKESHFI